jgi:hypothetical protein
MNAPRPLFVQLAVVVAAAYAAQSLIPRFFDTCIDGQCTARGAEIAISLLIPLGVAAFVVVAEMFLFGETLRQALQHVGYGRPDWPRFSWPF